MKDRSNEWKQCPVCGKWFFPTAEHVFKIKKQKDGISILFVLGLVFVSGNEVKKIINNGG